MDISKYIGGFFELELNFSQNIKSIAEEWQLPKDQTYGFANARSALAALLANIPTKNIWLPAYLCPSIYEAVLPLKNKTNFYPQNENLQPDVNFLTKNIKSGDIILAINYFGQYPGHDFIEFIKTFKDCIFIEDCAQAIDTGKLPWGTWRIYSPRKLLGVADGGYIISCQNNHNNKKPMSILNKNASSNWHAPIMRFEHPNDNTSWHNANQMREKEMHVSNKSVSRLSHQILWSTDIENIISKRRKNYSILADHLYKIAFIKSHQIDFCPFGFPILLPYEQRKVLREKLRNIGIFAPIHWENMPSPKNIFSKEHKISQMLLTLPCDQRYNEKEMKFIGESVNNILNGDYL